MPLKLVMVIHLDYGFQGGPDNFKAEEIILYQWQLAIMAR